MPVVLRVSEYGSADPAELQFDKKVITIGRDGVNDVTLHDQKVSQRHARIQFDDDRWMVVDLESKNKTYVGTTEVSGEAHPLENGDAIHIGDFKIVFSQLLWSSDNRTRSMSAADDNAFIRPILRLSKVLQNVRQTYDAADAEARDDELQKTLDTVFHETDTPHPAVERIMQSLQSRKASQEPGEA